MITEDYVSFQTAELLKEKGMHKSCFNHYVQKNNHDGTSEAVTVCTLQMAMKWLRYKGIYIQIRRNINTYLYGAIMLKDGSDIYATIPSELETYEEAVEAALKYSLENLI